MIGAGLGEKKVLGVFCAEVRELRDCAIRAEFDFPVLPTNISLEWTGQVPFNTTLPLIEGAEAAWGKSTLFRGAVTTYTLTEVFRSTEKEALVYAVSDTCPATRRTHGDPCGARIFLTN